MGEDLLKKVGDRIRKLRKARGMTQEALAEACDLSYKYLGAVERAEVNPGILNLSKIAEGLSRDLIDIVNVEKRKGTEEDSLREEIFGLLAGKDLEELKRALTVLKAVFN